MSIKISIILINLSLLFYSCSLTKSDQLKNQEHDIVYGSGCGRAGVDPYHRMLCEKYIDEKNIRKLEEWYESDTLTIKVYATEALIRIHNSKPFLTDDQIESINKFKKSNKRIRTCSGCIYSTDRIKEVLKKYAIK